MPTVRLVALEIGAVVLLLVVGLTSGVAPLLTDADHRSTRGGGLLQAAIVAIVALVAGAVGLAAAVSARRRTRDPDQARRYGLPFRVQPRDRASLAALIVLLVAGSLAVVALAGQLVDRGHRPVPQSVPRAPIHSERAGRVANARSRPDDGNSMPWAIIGLVALCGGAFGVALRVRARRTAAAVEVAQDPDELALASTEAVRALSIPRDDREAILAAYAAMEAALAADGVRRRPAEAPREYLERAFADSRGARPLAGRRLTSLFERARFGTEPITRSDRLVAEQALLDLGARS